MPNMRNDPVTNSPFGLCGRTATSEEEEKELTDAFSIRVGTDTCFLCPVSLD